MNGELQLPDMLQCINASGEVNVNGGDMSLLERQRAIMKWQKDTIFQRGGGGGGYICSTTGLNGESFSVQAQVGQVQNFQGFMVVGDSVSGEAADHSVKADPGLGNGWAELGNFDPPCLGFGLSAGLASSVDASGFDMNSAVPRTLSCPPPVANVATESKSRESSLSEKISCPVGRECFKKRKAGSKVQNSKIVEADDKKDKKDKKIKVCVEEEESKITEQVSSKNNAVTNNRKRSNRETSSTSKENSKVSEVQKLDYIHVRARRGQATDSHSLAERVRREKISERMKYLQDIVPGCNKITGKAGMLDEIINYVQSLQRQVEFLSMKLAAVNPRLEFNVDDLLAKEVFPAYAAPSFPAMEMVDMANPAYLQFIQAQQMAAYCGTEMWMSPSDMSLRRTFSAPVSMPETFIDSSCYTQMQPSWEADLSTSYSAAFDQGRLQSFPTQPHTVTGSMEARNLKRET